MKLSVAVLAGLAAASNAQFTTRPIGGNPATWTPSTTRPIGGNPATWTPTTTRPIGGNPATWTPTTTTSSTLLGTNKCTYGPSYWCASEANAKECNYDYGNCATSSTLSTGTTASMGSSSMQISGARPVLSSTGSVLGSTRPATTYAPLGSDPATWSPVATTRPALVGSNSCTWGPSYWCASEANAKQCNYDFANCANANDDTFSATIVQPKGKGAKKGRHTTPGGSTWDGSAWGAEPTVEEVADWVVTLPESDPLVTEISSGISGTAKTTGFTIADCQQGRDFICSSAEAAAYCNYEYSKCSEVRPTIQYSQATTLPATTLPATTFPATTLPATTLPATTFPATTYTTRPATTFSASTRPATYTTRPSATYLTTGSATTYRPTTTIG